MCLLMLGWLAFLLVFLIASPETVWARAGGGENYGGGGGGGFDGGGGFGGSFGGDGYGYSYPIGGGGEGIPIPPQVAIPILIMIVIFIIVTSAHQVQEQQVTRTIQRGRQKQREQELQAAVAAIQQRDPAFTLDAFIQRVSTAFLKIQTAWSEQKLPPVRAFLSDGIFERFQLQIGMLQAEGIRNVMEQVRILNSDIVAMSSTAQFDTIHVRIQATALDYNVQLQSGRRIPGSDHTGAFTEIWSFCRRPGAKSLSAGGAIEGNCPRCGALLKIVDVAKCDSCGAQVNSGEYDWVLAEITQESEWQVPAAEQQLPGVPELIERDPGFNVQHIEDRVSVMFWRMRAAEFYRDIKYAEPVLTPEFRKLFAKSMASNGRYWKTPAVGQVELVQVQGNDQQDELQVLIRWSGTLIDRISGRETVLKPQSITTQIYTLIRNRNVQSNPLGTFTSAGCANCGAPLQVNESGACDYCGAVLTNGEFDWVLHRVERYSPQQAHEHALQLSAARSRLDRVTPETSTELPLSILARVMFIDGELDPRELKALQSLAQHRNIGPEQLNLILEQARDQQAELPIPTTPQEGRSFLMQLIEAILVDGKISRAEKQLINSYAQKIGLTPADVSLALNAERARAYQAARRVTGF
jgi:predicted lipid-binding transport protein (Tim44 family)/uncharacterized tellurite resistance protein B-like protein